MSNSINLQDIRDFLKRECPKCRIVMSSIPGGTVFMTTEYGDVKITEENVEFPGNSYRFARGNRTLSEYCGFVIEGVEKYSSPIWRLKQVFEKKCHRGLKSDSKQQIYKAWLYTSDNKGRFVSKPLVYSSITDYLRLPLASGDLCFNGDYVKFPGISRKFSRKDMTLETFCDYIINGIVRYNIIDIKDKLEMTYHRTVRTDNEKHCLYMGSEYGDVRIDAGSVSFPGNSNIYYRTNKDNDEFCSFIISGLERFSNLDKNIIYDISDSDKYGKTLESIYFRWKTMLEKLSGYTFLSLSSFQIDAVKELFKEFAVAVIGQTRIYADMFGVEPNDVLVKNARFLGESDVNNMNITIASQAIAFHPVYVKEIILHEIGHLFLRSHNLGFFKNLEAMCKAAGLIHETGFVVPELFKSNTNGSINIIPIRQEDWNNYEETRRIISVGGIRISHKMTECRD